jgi:hypothetical protein
MLEPAVSGGIFRGGMVLALVLGAAPALADVHSAQHPTDPAVAATSVPAPTVAKLAAVASVDRHSRELTGLADSLSGS